MTEQDFFIGPKLSHEATQQPHLYAIIWQYYCSIYKDGTKAGQVAEEYMQALLKVQQ